ncbi:MAG: DUF1592 domain-containing protein [Planctomycetota bacterium]
MRWSEATLSVELAWNTDCTAFFVLPVTFRHGIFVSLIAVGVVAAVCQDAMHTSVKGQPPLWPLHEGVSENHLSGQESDPAQERIASTSEAMQELARDRKRLLDDLEHLNAEAEHLRIKIRLIDRQRQLQSQWEDLNHRLETDAIGEEETIRVIALRDDLSHRIDALWLAREVQEQRRDVDQQLAILREMPLEALPFLQDRLRLLRDQLKRLEAQVLAVLNLNHESLHAAATSHGLNEDQWHAIENQIESAGALIELVGEWIEANENHDLDDKERLADELKALLAQSEDQLIQGLDRDRATWQPVEINADSLSQFDDVEFSTDIVPLLKKGCFECHSHDASSGQLDIQSLISEQPLVANRAMWINIIEQTKNHVMPPEDANALSRDDREMLVLSLHNLIHRFDYSEIRHPGYEPTRRLTHAEYDRTVSELFGVPVTIAARFPTELAGVSGFHNSANTLFLQPMLMERYITAADELVETLLPSEPKTPRQRKAIQQVAGTLSFASIDDAAAHAILERFVGRAFRRSLNPDERASVIKRYQSLRDLGEVTASAIGEIVRQTLMSPAFLLKFESAPDGNDDQRISDWELASRLSYFLWASMPDDRLFRLAASGTLHQRDVLRREIDRMLSDKRSSALGSEFAAQWLGTQHIGTRVRLDPIDNPWCTESLMKAMREETEIFFHSLVADNQPITQLISADHTFLNEELARHYRRRDVRGDAMRRVSIVGNHRRGVLGHASILAVTSFPHRTSPVVRGKWVLETLLGTPPPPPPPNASEFDDDMLENERLTIRQKLAKHRASPQCRACHQDMDPIGLSLERFDWFGRLRRDRLHRIDDRGELPDGTQFQGLEGLNAVLTEQRTDNLIRQLVQKLLSYALGRQLEYYDEPAVRRIIAAIDQEENRMQPLIHQIVQSYPFQYQRRLP